MRRKCHLNYTNVKWFKVKKKYFTETLFWNYIEINSWKNFWWKSKWKKVLKDYSTQTKDTRVNYRTRIKNSNTKIRNVFWKIIFTNRSVLRTAVSRHFFFQIFSWLSPVISDVFGYSPVLICGRGKQVSSNADWTDGFKHVLQQLKRRKCSQMSTPIFATWLKSWIRIVEKNCNFASPPRVFRLQEKLFTR